MELRDSITLVLGTQAQFEHILPANASEALIKLDKETGEVTTEFSKRKEPPIGRAVL